MNFLRWWSIYVQYVEYVQYVVRCIAILANYSYRSSFEPHWPSLTFIRTSLTFIRTSLALIDLHWPSLTFIDLHCSWPSSTFTGLHSIIFINQISRESRQWGSEWATHFYNCPKPSSVLFETLFAMEILPSKHSKTCVFDLWHGLHIFYFSSHYPSGFSTHATFISFCFQYVTQQQHISLHNIGSHSMVLSHLQ